MDIATFLSQLLVGAPETLVRQTPLIILVTKTPTYCLQPFFEKFFQKKYSQPMLRLSSVEKELQAAEVVDSGQTSLFGEVVSEQRHAQYGCWLTDFFDISQSPASEVQQAYNFLVTTASGQPDGYSSGPYWVALTERDFEVSRKKYSFDKHARIVTLADQCTSELVSLMFECAADRPLAPSLALQIARARVSWDVVYAIILYGAFINRKRLDELIAYAQTTSLTQEPLRELSDVFWRKNSAAFFQIWDQLSFWYPEQFWVWFFSQQIFIAAQFITRSLTEKNLKPQGQEHSLSPWFTWKAGYKEYSVDYCARLHKHLFALDSELKNGSSFDSLEHFFAYHFLNI